MSTAVTGGGALRRQAPLELSRNLRVGVCKEASMCFSIHVKRRCSTNLIAICVCSLHSKLSNALYEPMNSCLIACAPNAQITPVVQQHVSPPPLSSSILLSLWTGVKEFLQDQDTATSQTVRTGLTGLAYVLSVQL